MGRPSRAREIDEVRALAGGVTAASVRSFFSRPERLSPELRQRIAEAVVEVGYRPIHPRRGALAGARLGFELPRAYVGATQSRPMTRRFQDLVVASQRQGAIVVPFIVDPVVHGLTDVVGGTDDERADPQLALYGWRRRYAETLAPAEYQRVMRAAHLKGFFVDDLHVDDPRLQDLREKTVAYVAFGQPMRTLDGAIVTDERHTFVENDNRSGIARMVRLLRGAGCRRFAHLGFQLDDSVVPYARRDAVAAAIGAPVPQPLEVHYQKISTDRPASVARIVEWLNLDDLADVDAVICDSDSLCDLLRRAAPAAGRRLARGLAASDGTDRPLMTCGNDDAPVRTEGDADPETWWMTMHADGPRLAQKGLDLMAARLETGSTDPTSELVPPIIVGAPGHDPQHESSIEA